MNHLIRKRVFTLFLAGILAISLAACGNTNSDGNAQDISSEAPQTSGQENGMQPNTSEQVESSNAGSDGSNILIAYFTAAENSGVDAIASASYTTIDGQAVGRVRAVADMIQENVGGDLFSIHTSVVYPTDGGELIDYLDTDAPYLTVRRAWHTEHNRPVILTELKTKAAERNIPLPDRLAECLREVKKKSTSDYVIANQDGEPLSYTQFKRLWQYIVTRTAKPRIARKLVDGKYVKYMLYPKLGEKARNNGHVVYSLDFDVTPHMLRHTYITNLIHASVDPKTVQYLAGHGSSKITMDIYAKVKYNKPEQLAGVLSGAFAEWDGGEYEAAQS